MDRKYCEFYDIVNFNKYIDFKLLLNKTFLITGSTGLIGTYLIDFLMFLNEKYDLNIKIIAVAKNLEKLNQRFMNYKSSRNFCFIIQDIISPFNIDDKIDYIIHTASPANPFYYANFPVDVIKANIMGTINMLELCKNKKSKLILTSSGEVYGEQTHDGNGFTEAQPGIVDSSKVRSCYTESKRCSETLVSSYVHQYNVNAMVARLSFIYGPTYSQDDTRVIFQFVNNFINSSDIIMKSNGEQIRSYTYVSDCIIGLLCMLLNGKNGEIYNISNPKSIISIRDIALKLKELSKSKLNIVFDFPDSKESIGYSPFKNAVQNSSKLMNIGWKPQYDFDAGLELMIKDRMDFIRKG